MYAKTAWYIVEQWSKGQINDPQIIEDAIQNLEDAVDLHGLDLEMPTLVKRLLVSQFRPDPHFTVYDLGDRKYSLGVPKKKRLLVFDVRHVVQALRSCSEVSGSLVPPLFLLFLSRAADEDD